MSFYISTPIYYVNDLPHIGHAYTSIIADIIARSVRLYSKETLLLTGTDEHGQKVERSALKKSMNVIDFTNKFSKIFRDLTEKVNMSNNDFIRTTEIRHHKAVLHFWDQLKKSDNIYLDKYKGWYSIRDEAFYEQSELMECGSAPTGSTVEWVEEESYFFKLSKWQQKLLAFYQENPNFIKPQFKYKEVINFVKSGLKDISISRTKFSWGIKIPDSKNHVVYVWLDALINYITAIGYPNDLEKIEKFWPIDVHVIGKDIILFHAVYWPAFLMAVGLKPPKCILVHGWWLSGGEKISKSLGNIIDPFDLIDKFGADQVRYFLIREITLGLDGNFVVENLVSRVSSDLSNKIGNLVHRVMMFLYTNNSGCIPLIDNKSVDLIYNWEILKFAEVIVKENKILLQNLDLNKILNNILLLADKANFVIAKEAPWDLLKSDINKAYKILYSLTELLRYIGILLQPFLPESSVRILDQLKIPLEDRSFKHLIRSYAIKPGIKISPPKQIFPKNNYL